MGRAHAASGVLAGELVASAAHVEPLSTSWAVFVGVTAAGALLPDLDHPSGSVTRALGPVGWVACHLLRGFSHGLYLATKGQRDEDEEKEHRGVTHTVLFAAAAGLLAYAGCLIARQWVPLPAMLIGCGLALGCLVHCLGDSCTVSGCSFLFPLYLRGESWYEVRLFGPLSFHTGHAVERVIITPALMLGCVLAAPGVWPTVTAMIGR